MKRGWALPSGHGGLIRTRRGSLLTEASVVKMEAMQLKGHFIDHGNGMAGRGSEERRSVAGMAIHQKKTSLSVKENKMWTGGTALCANGLVGSSWQLTGQH